MAVAPECSAPLSESSRAQFVAGAAALRPVSRAHSPLRVRVEADAAAAAAGATQLRSAQKALHYCYSSRSEAACEAEVAEIAAPPCMQSDAGHRTDESTAETRVQVAVALLDDPQMVRQLGGMHSPVAVDSFRVETRQMPADLMEIVVVASVLEADVEQVVMVLLEVEAYAKVAKLSVVAMLPD